MTPHGIATSKSGVMLVVSDVIYIHNYSYNDSHTLSVISD